MRVPATTDKIRALRCGSSGRAEGWSVMVSVLLEGRGVVGDDRRRLDHRVLRHGRESVWGGDGLAKVQKTAAESNDQ
jgi:hypothetical protein